MQVTVTKSLYAKIDELVTLRIASNANAFGHAVPCRQSIFLYLKGSAALRVDCTFNYRFQKMMALGKYRIFTWFDFCLYGVEWLRDIAK